MSSSSSQAAESAGAKAAYIYRDAPVEVASDRVVYTESTITSQFTYESTRVEQLPSGGLRATPVRDTFVFKTDRQVPKVGVMIVGWGGNNGTTVTAGIEANRAGVTWETKAGVRKPDYVGSLTQSSTVNLGIDSRTNEDVFVPMTRVLPMLHPNDMVLGGWDISSLNLGDAMKRAAVIDIDLQRQVYPALKQLTPLPSVCVCALWPLFALCCCR
jgi:myo-inositol-1-phosphate synthase